MRFCRRMRRNTARRWSDSGIEGALKDSKVSKAVFGGVRWLQQREPPDIGEACETVSGISRRQRIPGSCRMRVLLSWATAIRQTVPSFRAI